MKKYFLLIFIFLLVSTVLANNKIKLDLNLEKEMLVPVLENDMIEFYLNGNRHIINVEKIMPESMDLDVFLLVDENQKVSYVTVKKGITIKIDLNKDGDGELFLGFGGHYGNKTLLFMYNPNSESTLSSITGDVVKETTKTGEKSYKIYYIGVILVAIIVLISMLVYINIRKKEV